jgi:hypothetical protein
MVTGCGTSNDDATDDRDTGPGGSLVAATQASPTTAVWQLSAEMLTKLGEPIVISDLGYTIRVPKGYTPLQTPRVPGLPANAKLVSAAWAGDARADQSMPFVLFMSFLDAEYAQRTWDEVVDKYVGAATAGATDTVRGETQFGQINGVVFARCDWSCTKPGLGSIHGFVMCGYAGERLIQVFSQDKVEHYREALPIAEAAAFTLQKQ